MSMNLVKMLKMSHGFSNNLSQAARTMFERREAQLPPLRAVISEQLLNRLYVLNEPSISLFGSYYPHERLFQVISITDHHRNIPLQTIGCWRSNLSDEEQNASGLLIRGNAYPPDANYEGQPVQVEIYDETQYTVRHSGLTLAERCCGKRAALVGLGSVGSRLGLALLRLGVHLTVFDPDRIDIANPIRWGIMEAPELLIGRTKVRVFEEFAQRVFPTAKVTAFDIDITRQATLFEQTLESEPLDLIIVSTDTINSRREVNTIAVQRGWTALYIGLSDGAESGQILLVRPGDPCWLCFSDGEEIAPEELKVDQQEYGVPSVAVPALAINIDIISALAAKLASVILSGEPIEPYLRQFDHPPGTVLWFSTQPDTWIFDDFAQRCIAQIERRPDCPVCASRPSR